MLVEGTKEREREEREERVPDCLVVVAFRVVNDGALNTLANATLEVHNHAIRKPHFLWVRVHSFLCHGRFLVSTFLSRSRSKTLACLIVVSTSLSKTLARVMVVAGGRKKALESLDLSQSRPSDQQSRPREKKRGGG